MAAPDAELPDVPWTQLRAPGGRTAENVPGLLAALVDPSRSAPEVAQQLTLAISHCDLMSEAAPYTLPFLARVVETDP